MSKEQNTEQMCRNSQIIDDLWHIHSFYPHHIQNRVLVLIVDERLYRAVRPDSLFWKVNGTLSSAAFKDKKGLSAFGCFFLAVPVYVNISSTF